MVPMRTAVSECVSSALLCAMLPICLNLDLGQHYKQLCLIMSILCPDTSIEALSPNDILPRLKDGNDGIVIEFIITGARNEILSTYISCCTSRY